jgi:hypothetical protein
MTANVRANHIDRDARFTGVFGLSGVAWCTATRQTSLRPIIRRVSIYANSQRLSAQSGSHQFGDSDWELGAADRATT